MLATNFLRGYIAVIEDTLLIYVWLNKDNFLMPDFEIGENNVDYRAMNCIKVNKN